MTSRLVLRLIAPTIAVSVLLLVLGGTAAWYMHRLQTDASRLLDVNVTKVRAAGELAIVSHELRNDLSQFLITGDRSYLGAASELQDVADRWIRQAEQLADSAEERDLVAKIRHGYDRYFQEFQDVAKAPPGEHQRQAVIDLFHRVITNQILRPIYDYRKLNQTTMDEISQRNGMIARTLGLGLLLLGTCGAVAGLLLGFGIARGVERSIVQLQVPIHDAAGKLNEVVGPIVVSSADDIQERDVALKSMSERVGEVVKSLQESQRAALRAEQLAAVGQLAAGLAHELRNPLTSIRVLIQSAKEEGTSVVLGGRDLQVIDEEIMRLDRSIQAFLDYARPATPEKHHLDLAQILEQTIRLVSGRAANQGVAIECETPDEPIRVDADAGQMRQVFLNLLLNALEAAPADGRVHVRMRPEEASGAAGATPRPGAVGRWLVIDVADSGTGLASDVKQRLFEPFVSTKDTGTGLGLPICKRVVEEHGGTILADNRPQGGAVFTVRLPIETAVEPETLQRPSP
jgi:signal transduction histidine kinase